MALWGHILKANTKTKVQVPDEASLIVNQAVLPKECSGVVSLWISGMMDDEGATSEPICIAHLDWARFPQVNFEALIPNGDEVEFEVRGASDVHLLGFFSPIEDEEDEEDDDMDSDDEHALLYGDSDEDGDSDEEGHTGPKIEELSSSEEETAPAPKKAAPAPVSQPPAKKQKTSETTSKATAEAPKPAQPKQQAQPAQQQSPKQDGDKKKRKRNKKNKGGDSQ